MRPLVLRSALALALAAPAGLAAAHPFARAHAAVVEAARGSAPIVLTGSQLPAWSRLAAQGLAATYPSGATTTGNSLRSAHNGQIVVPPDARTGVDPDTISAWKWDKGWKQVPVQVDQRFPYFLANGHSSFSVYSGTDEELTYAWAPDRHDTGEEAWKKVFGTCTARMAETQDEVSAAARTGVVNLNDPTDKKNTGTHETAADYLAGHDMQDPVPTLDDDDEIALMARDAGAQAPAGTPAPAGTVAPVGGAVPVPAGQTVTVNDPLNPGSSSYIYLFLRPGGSSFTAANSPYVHMVRDANADEWIDRNSFGPSDPSKIGTSNTSYGPNLKGTVCRTAPDNDGGVKVADGVARPSTDRVPRDGMTVTTPTYKLTASGRWMVRGYQIADPPKPAGSGPAQGSGNGDGNGNGNGKGQGDTHGQGHSGDVGDDDGPHYGPDLVSRWKGRAFQQSPDSTVSVVGFEDEQVNWEANSALLGWRQGPVRAIREVWGADSGTNVTKTETYYRDADTFAYHVRVHPIPPDGLYTSWDYNPGAVSTYYNLEKQNGVAIDGVNDDTGQIDQLPVANQPAYFDAPDPTFDLPSAVDRPEEVAGNHGGMVYEFEFTGATSALNAAAVPYYRDDACLDDGTGDAPLPRPWPGETTTDSRVKDGYVAYWKAHGAPATLTYADLQCNPAAPAGTVPWKKFPFAGAFGQHGIHFFVTHDSDNAWMPKPVDEISGQQWRFAVPMSAPTNVLMPYSLDVTAKLVATAASYQ